MNELDGVASHIFNATTYVDVFGAVRNQEGIHRQVKRIYRSLARVLHPDRYHGSDKSTAQKAFQALNDFKQQADKAIEAGEYGIQTSRVTISTKKFQHLIGKQLADGDIATIYRSVSTTGVDQRQTVCKIARHGQDADMMKNEAAVLKLLHAETVDDTWKRHVPKIVDAFAYDNAGRRVQANVIEYQEGFYTLRDIRREYSNGVSAGHAIWMFRRMLMALGFAYDNGVLHGAVVPDHVMILPEHHGVVLVDWCYASRKTDDAYAPIKALARGYCEWYPREVLAEEVPTEATDIALAVRSVIYVLGGNPVTAVMPETVPRKLRAFLRGCLQQSQAMRPQNAWLLLEEFDELIEALGAPYYPRRFLQFTMPTGVV